MRARFSLQKSGLLTPHSIVLLARLGKAGGASRARASAPRRVVSAILLVFYFIFWKEREISHTCTFYKNELVNLNAHLPLCAQKFHIFLTLARARSSVPTHFNSLREHQWHIAECFIENTNALCESLSRRKHTVIFAFKLIFEQWPQTQTWEIRVYIVFLFTMVVIICCLTIQKKNLTHTRLKTHLYKRVYMRWVATMFFFFSLFKWMQIYFFSKLFLLYSIYKYPFLYLRVNKCVSCVKWSFFKWNWLWVAFQVIYILQYMNYNIVYICYKWRRSLIRVSSRMSVKYYIQIYIWHSKRTFDVWPKYVCIYLLYSIV